MELKEQELSHEDVVKNLKKVSVTIVFNILAHVNIQKVLPQVFDYILCQSQTYFGNFTGSR